MEDQRGGAREVSAGPGACWCLHPEPSPGGAVQAPVPALALRAAPASDRGFEEQQHPVIRCPWHPVGTARVVLSVLFPSHRVVGC